jgi:hypothetical protein
MLWGLLNDVGCTVAGLVGVGEVWAVYTDVCVVVLSLLSLLSLLLSWLSWLPLLPWMDHNHSNVPIEIQMGVVFAVGVCRYGTRVWTAKIVCWGRPPSTITTTVNQWWRCRGCMTLGPRFGTLSRSAAKEKYCFGALAINACIPSMVMFLKQWFIYFEIPFFEKH